MPYEFTDPHIPGHKCAILKPIKISNTRTNLVCTVCKKIVGWWDEEPTDKIASSEIDGYYSDAMLEKLR